MASGKGLGLARNASAVRKTIVTGRPSLARKAATLEATVLDVARDARKGRAHSCADFPPPTTTTGAGGGASGPAGAVHESKSSILDAKCIECNTGPEKWAALAAAGANDSGKCGLLFP
jgi:hypothetical protein